MVPIRPLPAGSRLIDAGWGEPSIRRDQPETTRVPVMYWWIEQMYE